MVLRVATLVLSLRVERNTVAPAPQHRLVVSGATTDAHLMANVSMRTAGLARVGAHVARQDRTRVTIAEPADVRVGQDSVAVDWTFTAAQIDAGTRGP